MEDARCVARQTRGFLHKAEEGGDVDTIHAEHNAVVVEVYAGRMALCRHSSESELTSPPNS